MKRTAHRASCARAWEAEAVHDGRLGAADIARHERHAAQCAECRALRAHLSVLRQMARSTPSSELSSLQARRLRAALLQSAALPRAERRPMLLRTAIAVAACLVVVTLLVARMQSTPPLVASSISRAVEGRLKPYPQASIVVLGGARWSRHTSTMEEAITLLDGALDVRVPSQHYGHHFHLSTPDGEIEVWGTRFVVVVHSGNTERLDVREGLVAWRRPNAAQLVLRSGEAWTPVIAAARRADPTVAPMPAPRVRDTVFARNRRRAESTALGEPAASVPTPTPSVFAQAVQAMDRGDFAVAARSFEEFCATFPNDDRAEDAAYLRIVALTRASRGVDAEQAATDFLARYPTALRRWEAAVVIARAARVRGDCARVGGVLNEFAGDARRSAIAESLRAGCSR